MSKLVISVVMSVVLLTILELELFVGNRLWNYFYYYYYYYY